MLKETKKLRELIEKGLISAKLTTDEVEVIIRYRMANICNLEQNDPELRDWLINSIRALNDGLLPKKRRKINAPTVQKIKGRRLPSQV